MADAAPGRKTPRPKEAYGGASVEERAAAMRGTLTDGEIAARNVIPEANPAGEPHRIIAEEYFSENDAFSHYKPARPDDPGPAASAPPKPGVLRESRKITDRLSIKLGLKKASCGDPDYWGPASIMTGEEAELTKHMRVRMPETFEQVVAGCGMGPERTQELLDALCIKGIVEYSWENLDGKNPGHKKRYVLPMFVPGSAESMVMNQRQMEEHPEIGTFFERMAFLPLTAATKMVPPGGAGIGMHVIPVEHAIKQESVTASVEHISHWLEKYDRYSAGVCSCSIAERSRGDNGGRDVQNWCLGMGDMADYRVETGKGHYVTYDEVIDILLQAEKNGYVHQITNIDGEEKIFAICNCDASVCYALRTSQLFNTPNMSASAYRAHIDNEKCVACAGCVEVCPAGAVQLGQKLPRADGSAVEYPVQPLPDALPWGEGNWDPDYKDSNRIETHGTGTAPCKAACPAHIPVQGCLQMAAEGRYRAALALIKKENPFPAVCGRVCNKPCEDACTRGTVDEAVAIADVEDLIARKDLDAACRYVPEPVIPSTRGRLPEKIAIVGGGPAGLSCAYHLAQMGYNPTVFERNGKPGGMMIYGIPSYKLEKGIVEAEIDILRAMGVEIRCGITVGKDITLDQLRDEGYTGFYLAIGCQGGRMAGIGGEDGAGVSTAIDFLRTAIENPDHTVAGSTVVIGGGNAAVDAARVSMRCGASKVAMVCLEQRDEMPALPKEIVEAEEDGVEIMNGWGPAKIELAEDGSVEGVALRRCTRVSDDEGRFSPVYDEDDTTFVACENVILSVGQSIEWGDLLVNEDAIDIGRDGRVAADPTTYQTMQPDIFIGGDAYTGPRFIIDAIAAGHEAAISLHRYVQRGSSLTRSRNQRSYVELDKSDIDLTGNGYDRAGRQVPARSKVAGIVHNWTDPRQTFTEEQLKTECARCLKCGTSVVDTNKCIGCGLCTTRCEFGAIHLARDVPEASRMWRSEDKVKAILPYAARRGIKIIGGTLAGKAET